MLKKSLTLVMLAALLLSSCSVFAPAPASGPKIEPSAAQPSPAVQQPTVEVSAEAPTAVPSSTPTQEPVLSPGGRYQLAGETVMSGAYRIVWARDGDNLAVIAQDGAAVLDAQSLAVLYTYSVPEEGYILDFSADGHTIATTSDQQTVTLTDIRSAETRTIESGIRFGSAAFSPEGSLLVLAAMDEWAAHIWDVESGQFRFKITGFETAAPVYNVVFAANVIDLLWYARGTLQLQNIASRQLSPSLGHEDFVTTFARAKAIPLLVSAAGGTVDGEFAPLLYVWDPVTGELLIRLKQEGLVFSLDFSYDDRLLAAGVGQDVVVFTTSDMNVIETLSGHGEGIVSVSFSPDGTLASLDSGGFLRLWQAVSP